MQLQFNIQPSFNLKFIKLWWDVSGSSQIQGHTERLLNMHMYSEHEKHFDLKRLFTATQMAHYMWLMTGVSHPWGFTSVPHCHVQRQSSYLCTFFSSLTQLDLGSMPESEVALWTSWVKGKKRNEKKNSFALTEVFQKKKGLGCRSGTGV